jgi:hypothetical protein
MYHPEVFNLNIVIKYQFFLIVSIVTLIQFEALANPWLLPPNKMTVSAKYDYAYADQEYLATSGKLTPFSLNGEYIANTFTLGTRIGIRKWFEIEVNLPFKVVTYESDPVILLESAAGNNPRDFYQENIINFNQSTMGFGDLQVATRFQLSKYPIATSLELAVTAPTGYSPPSGTFGDNPNDIDQFIEEVGDIAQPDNIQDDVTLGDGVFAFTPTLHFGYGNSFGFFMRWSEGVKFRNQEAGDLLISEFKLGQFLKSWLLIYAGAYHEYTLTKGRPIGISVAAIDASLDAQEYSGLNNLKPILVTLDRDQLVIPVGALIKVNKKVNLSGSYSMVVWGRNVAKSHVMSIGVTILNDY